MKKFCFVIAVLFALQPIIATAQSAPVTTQKHHKSNGARTGTPSNGARMGTSPSTGNPGGHQGKRKHGQGNNGSGLAAGNQGQRKHNKGNSQGASTGQLNNGNRGNNNRGNGNQGNGNRGNGNTGNGNQGNGNRGNGNAGNGNTRNGNNAGSNNSNNGNTRNTNINNNNVNVNNTIANPVYGGGGAYGWNGGSPWYPTSGYYGGGFWGAMAIGVTSAAVGAAVYGSIAGPNNTTYNSYQVQPNTPGYTFLQNYQLVQVECGPPNLVVVYGPENSVVCAAPNNLVAAGNYTLDTQTLSLTPMH